MPTYHGDIPKNCPYPGANSYQGKIYRGVKQQTIVDKDFLSHAERPKSRCDRTTCEAWGLSVWLNIDDAQFARRASSFIRTKLYIAEGRVNKNDGCVMNTPSNDQPNHYTFWKDINVSFTKRFTIILWPEADAT